MTTETAEPRIEYLTLTTRTDERTPDVIYHDAADGQVMTLHVAAIRCPQCYGVPYPRVDVHEGSHSR